MQEAPFYTYGFYIVLSDYEGKRKEPPSVNEVRFTDSLEWLEICILNLIWALPRNFSFQYFYKSQTFNLFPPPPNSSDAAACSWEQVKTSSKCYLTALLRIDEHSATVDDNKEFEGGKKEKGKQWLQFFFFFKQVCARMCVCLCVRVCVWGNCTHRRSDDQRGRSNLKTQHCGWRSRFMLCLRAVGISLSQHAWGAHADLIRFPSIPLNVGVRYIWKYAARYERPLLDFCTHLHNWNLQSCR